VWSYHHATNRSAAFVPGWAQLALEEGCIPAPRADSALLLWQSRYRIITLPFQKLIGHLLRDIQVRHCNLVKELPETDAESARRVVIDSLHYCFALALRWPGDF
jgi:hypothetical protein